MSTGRRREGLPAPPEEITWPILHHTPRPAADRDLIQANAQELRRALVVAAQTIHLDASRSDCWRMGASGANNAARRP